MNVTETEKKALALVNEVRTDRGWSPHLTVSRHDCSRTEALFRAIERHEAYKQEVSDAVEAVFTGYHDAPIPWVVMRRKLEPFIIAKPDPLVEAMLGAWPQYADRMDACNSDANALRAALAARGLEVRKIGEGE